MNIPEEDTLTSPLDDTDLESPDSTDREQLISNSEREHESVANQDVNDGMHTLHSRNGARALPDNDEGTELMDLSSSRPSALKSPNSLKKSLRVSWGDMHGLPLVSEKEVEMWDRSPVDTRALQRRRTKRERRQQRLVLLCCGTVIIVVILCIIFLIILIKLLAS